MRFSVSRHVFAGLLLISVAGCAGPYYFSDVRVRQEAREDARATIARGELVLCEAGTYAIYTPGISAVDLDVVRELPRRRLPSGCVNPKAERSIAYAEAFNDEILRSISHRK